MFGEKALELLGEELAKEAIKQSPKIFKVFIEKVKSFGKVHIPEDPEETHVNEICKFLRAFRPAVRDTRGVDFYSFPRETNHFRRNDMTSQEIAQLWFRTNSNTWKRHTSKVLDRWVRISNPGTIPYFSGIHNVNFDYNDSRIKKRHPIIKTAHPFIMLSRLDVERFNNIGIDPVNEMVDLFLDGWKFFADLKYSIFRRGVAVQLPERAYVEGTFTMTTASSFCWNGDHKTADVHLKRFLIVAINGRAVDIMNVGIPYWNGGGSEYFDYLEQWMKEFRVRRRD